MAIYAQRPETKWPTGLYRYKKSRIINAAFLYWSEVITSHDQRILRYEYQL